MDRPIENLVRVPDEPAAKLLAAASQKLETKTKAPANSTVETILRELDSADAERDMLVLLAVALPARQRAWWACLSAHDLLGETAAEQYETLAAAEAWVYKPDDETYSAAYDALQRAEPVDPAGDCARCVVYSSGKLGPGDLAEHDAPPGSSEVAALTMVIDALSGISDNPEAYVSLVIDRAIDLAKGGSGKIAAGP